MAEASDERIEGAIAYLQESGLLQGFQAVLEKLIEDGAVRLDAASTTAKYSFGGDEFGSTSASALGGSPLPPPTAGSQYSQSPDAKGAKVLTAASAVLSSAASPIPSGLRAPIDIYDRAATELERFGAGYGGGARQSSVISFIASDGTIATSHAPVLRTSTGTGSPTSKHTRNPSTTSSN